MCVLVILKNIKNTYIILILKYRMKANQLNRNSTKKAPMTKQILQTINERKIYQIKQQYTTYIIENSRHIKQLKNN